MSQTPETVPPATERATAVMEGIGRGIGNLIVGTRTRLEQVPATIRSEAKRMESLVAVQSHETTQSEQAQVKAVEQPTTKKAEQIVDNVGQRLGGFAVATSLYFQKVAARTREEADDIWAEAQSIRHKSDASSQGKTHSL